MARRVLNFLAAVSLAALVSVAWLWARQTRYDGTDLDLFSFYSGALHARYTLRAGRTGVRLEVPPFTSAFRPPARSSRTDSIVGLIRNDQVEWPLRMQHGTFDLYVNFEGPTDEWRALYRELRSLPKNELVPALLEAMEDPERFVAAHYEIHYDTTWLPDEPGDPWHFAITPRADGATCYNYYGLRVVLSDFKKTGEGVTPGGIVTIVWSRARYDASQFPALRARWHRLLDRPAAVVSYPAAAAGASAIPALWAAAGLWKRVRRQRLRVRNRCTHCGYDLRATPDRCPECGAALTSP